MGSRSRIRFAIRYCCNVNSAIAIGTLTGNEKGGAGIVIGIGSGLLLGLTTLILGIIYGSDNEYVFNNKVSGYKKKEMEYYERKEIEYLKKQDSLNAKVNSPKIDIPEN